MQKHVLRDHVEILFIKLFESSELQVAKAFTELNFQNYDDKKKRVSIVWIIQWHFSDLQAKATNLDETGDLMLAGKYSIMGQTEANHSNTSTTK